MSGGRTDEKGGRSLPKMMIRDCATGPRNDSEDKKGKKNRVGIERRTLNGGGWT